MRRKAAEREAERQALDVLARNGITPVANSLTALAELAGEILAVKDIFRVRLSNLDGEQWRRSGPDGAEQLRAEVAMYERALDRSARVLGDIARLKIDERLAVLTEEQGNMIANVIRNVLRQLDMADQVDHARELLIIELRRLARGEGV